MESIKGAMEEAYNSFIHKHRENPSTRITLIQFDDINPQDVVYSNCPVKSAGKLKLKPRGNTPLLDAMAEAIDSTGMRLAALDESERPDQVLFVTITDGQENWSKRYTRRDINDRVTRQSSTYKWQFIYLGANQDSIAEARTLGILPQFALNYSHTGIGSANAFKSLTNNTVAYASASGASRAVADVNLVFDEDDRKKAEATS